MVENSLYLNCFLHTSFHPQKQNCCTDIARRIVQDKRVRSFIRALRTLFSESPVGMTRAGPGGFLNSGAGSAGPAWFFPAGYERDCARLPRDFRYSLGDRPLIFLKVRVK